MRQLGKKQYRDEVYLYDENITECKALIKLMQEAKQLKDFTRQDLIFKDFIEELAPTSIEKFTMTIRKTLGSHIKTSTIQKGEYKVLTEQGFVVLNETNVNEYANKMGDDYYLKDNTTLQFRSKRYHYSPFNVYALAKEYYDKMIESMNRAIEYAKFQVRELECGIMKTTDFLEERLAADEPSEIIKED